MSSGIPHRKHRESARGFTAAQGLIEMKLDFRLSSSAWFSCAEEKRIRWRSALWPSAKKVKVQGRSIHSIQYLHFYIISLGHLHLVVFQHALELLLRQVPVQLLVHALEQARARVQLLVQLLDALVIFLAELFGFYMKLLG